MNTKMYAMKRSIGCIAIVMGLLIATDAGAQQEQRWEDCYEELMSTEGSEASEPMDYELLSRLASHPFNINTATKEDLEQLPFLNDQQIADIMEYVYKYRALQSVGELYMIPSLGNACARLLSYFIVIGEPEEHNRLSWRNMLRYGKHKVVGTVGIPTYRSKGFSEGKYLGGPLKHWLRYTFDYTDRFELGLVAAQDAGEPFFSGRNRGYDYASFYLMLRGRGSLKALVVGRYRLRFGMGLVMNCDFGFGKQMLLQSLGRSSAAVRPHSSRSESNYLQGAAATFKLNKAIETTLFMSYRSVDGMLRTDGSGAVSAIGGSGYHRTETEMQHKHNTFQSAAGGNLRYFKNGFHVGGTVVYTALSRELRPDTGRIYKRWAAEGTRFYNIGLNYGYMRGRYSFSGEAATDNRQALSTINRLDLRLTSAVSVMAIQRYYAYKYNGLFARSFSEAGAVQDESGLYLGMNWKFGRRLSAFVYADYAYFAWPKYRQSFAGTHAWDGFLQLDYQHKDFLLTAQYRLRRRQRDNKDKSALMERNEQRGRIKAAYHLGAWQLRTQADLSYVHQQVGSVGYLVAQSLLRHYKWLTASASFDYFHTQGYDSRVYVYERGTLYDFSFPCFFGHGIRYSCNMRADLGSHFTLIGKVGTTDYFDRSVIGSGNQQINHSSRTDIQLQAIVKL